MHASLTSLHHTITQHPCAKKISHFTRYNTLPDFARWRTAWNFTTYSKSLYVKKRKFTSDMLYITHTCLFGRTLSLLIKKHYGKSIHSEMVHVIEDITTSKI
jgi:hypothetical protein